MAHLSFAIDGTLAVITLHNPPQNRITPQMADDLDAALAAIGRSEARAVLLKAEGPDFSFGGDIVEWPGMSQRERRALFERYMNSFNQFERLPIPTIAAVQGLCFGGGLELAVRADILFAGETARFGHPEQSIAIVTLLGGIYRIADKAGRAKATEWALSSEQVPAQEMARHGVVNRVVPDDELLSATLEYARNVASGPTQAHAAHKALLRVWSLGGKAAADEAMFDIAMPLFESHDVKLAIPGAIEAGRAGLPRPRFAFQGH
jgi:enoyl-CoA hydratase/carnithine racemase